MGEDHWIRGFSERKEQEEGDQYKLMGERRRDYPPHGEIRPSTIRKGPAEQGG
jgi:hypothetical protein